MTDRVNAITSRDRIVGAFLVLLILAAQALWMGRATAVLGVGVVLAYLLWIAARWKNDPASVLPAYLLAIAVQCLHFTEEFVTGFQRGFPGSSELNGAMRVSWRSTLYGLPCLYWRPWVSTGASNWRTSSFFSLRWPGVLPMAPVISS